MIDGMVNFAIFCPLTGVENTNLLPQTGESTRLFNILITDFLSTPNSKGAEPMPFGLPRANGLAKSDQTYLFYLRQICAEPHLNPDASAISASVTAFADWLDGECLAPKTWLPSIGIELDFRIQRIALIKICGDIAKHNFARLGKRVKTIRKLMEVNGHPISQDDGYTVIPDFYDKFHNDVFAYHLSTIAEFLNEIRREIFIYLQPEFSRALEFIGPDRMYRFNAPANIAQPFAVRMHWDLLNQVRRGLWFPQFTVTRSLKKQF